MEKKSNNKKAKLTKPGSLQVRIDEEQWLGALKRCLQTHEIDEEVDNLSKSVVFNAPKDMRALKPEAFTPQAVSIGPYHHSRSSELYEMERYKLAAAKRFYANISSIFAKDSQEMGVVNFRFEDMVVGEMKKMEWRIRNCYDKYIDCEVSTLAWHMTVDSIFVIECLQMFDKTAQDFKPLGRVLDPSGKTSTHNAVLRDLMMLENQIPLFVLQKILEIRMKSEAQARLQDLVFAAVKELSPFPIQSFSDDFKAQILTKGHLLEALYYALVPPQLLGDTGNVTEEKAQHEKLQIVVADREKMVKAFSFLWKVVSAMKVRSVRRTCNTVTKVTRMPLKIFHLLGNLPVLRIVKGPLIFIFGAFSSSADGDAKKKDDDDDATNETSIEILPTRDELAVPTVENLYSAGVRFMPTDGDITSVSFDTTTSTLYLPRIKIDSNTDVIIRNLIAFEAFVAPGGTLVFTRFVDFVNGMVDTVEDVNILKASGIIVHQLEKDLEVANLWNGLGGCVRLTRVEFLDQVIEEINKFYNRKWSVRMLDLFNYYVFGSWQILTFVAAAILLLVTCLEAFCSVYECKKWFNGDMQFEE